MLIKKQRDSLPEQEGRKYPITILKPSIKKIDSGRYFPVDKNGVHLERLAIIRVGPKPKQPMLGIYSNFLKITVPLVPPNPKELDMTYCMGISRA